MKTVKTFVAVLFAVTSAFGDDVKPDDFYALDGTQKYVAKARVEYARPEFCGDYYTNTLFAANSKFYKLSKGDKDKKIPWQPGMVKWFNVDGTKNVRDCGGWNGLKEGTLNRAIQAFADPGNFPMYVHCAGGADRTGTVCFIVEALCGVCEADLLHRV